MNDASFNRLLDQVELAYEMAKVGNEPHEEAAQKMRVAAKAMIMNGHIERETFPYAEMFMQAADPLACLANARCIFP